MLERDCLQIEERALNAWPSLQHAVCDGWLLRFAHGYTRRANSIIPLYSGDLDMAAKIETCQTHYARRNLPTVFKLFPFARPSGLDRVLAAKEYRREAETSVQVCSLADLAWPDEGEVRCWEQPDVAWLEAYVQMSGMARRDETLPKYYVQILPQLG